jgi:hypothetical protein
MNEWTVDLQYRLTMMMNARLMLVSCSPHLIKFVPRTAILTTWTPRYGTTNYQRLLTRGFQCWLNTRSCAVPSPYTDLPSRSNYKMALFRTIDLRLYASDYLIIKDLSQLVRDRHEVFLLKENTPIWISKHSFTYKPYKTIESVLSTTIENIQ